MKNWILALSLILLWISLSKWEEIKYKDFTLLNSFRIPFPAFTQGFIYNSTTKAIIESTGLERKSGIRLYYLNETSQEATPSIIKYKNNDDEFGEGLTYFKGKYYQLTWLNNVIHVFDKNFNHLKTADLPREMHNSGWGITNDDTYLYANWGTDEIFQIDPITLKTNKIILAKKPDGRPLKKLNEWEIVKDAMYWNQVNDNYSSYF